MSDWYYAVDNEQKGPINESELKANFATNKLPADTLVWKEGMENWSPANQVTAFSFRPPPAPAKVQSPDAGATLAATDVPAPTKSNPDSTKPIDLASLVSAKGEALEVDFEDAEKNKIFGILAYLIFFIPLLATKDSPFAKYHANQGLTVNALFVAVFIVVWVVEDILHMVNFFYLDWVVSLLYVPVILLALLGILNAAAGKCVPLPIVGGVKLLK